MFSYKKNQGSALLTALFIMTLVAIVATAMSTRLQLDIYRTRLVVTHDKLYLASQAVQFWAMNELNSKDKLFTKSTHQGLVAQYPKQLETLVNQMYLSGGLYDMQARFNINNMANKKYIFTFFQLLTKVIFNQTNKQRTDLTLAIHNWLTNYNIDGGEDTYTAYYLSQKPPYFAGHQLMQSSSELRLVRYVSANIYRKLEPFITALPETTPLNINTAPKELIMSLGNGLNKEQAQELIAARGDEGILDIKNIAELIKKFNLSAEQITIDSNYFLSIANVKSEEFNLVVYTLLKRNRSKDGQITVSVIRESFNGV